MSQLQFTLIQAALAWEDKEANRKHFTQLIQAHAQPGEIVVLPETFTTGFSMNSEGLDESMSGTTLEWMRMIAKEFRIILTGSFFVQEEHRKYNRLVWMQPDGQFGYYDKRHLFSYAEEDKHFSPGEKKLITQVKGWKIRTIICYDLRFPVWCRQEATNLYDVLLVVANWPVARVHAWKTLLQARAIENQCYVVAVNRTGSDGQERVYSGASCVVGPDGQFIEIKEGEDAILKTNLRKEHLEEYRYRFPFLRDADAFSLF